MSFEQELEIAALRLQIEDVEQFVIELESYDIARSIGPVAHGFAAEIRSALAGTRKV